MNRHNMKNHKKRTPEFWKYFWSQLVDYQLEVATSTDDAEDRLEELLTRMKADCGIDVADSTQMTRRN